MVEDDTTGLPGGKDIPPWLQPVPDDEPELSFWQTKRTLILSAVAAAVLLSLFITTLVVLYDDADTAPPKRIAAPAQPIKERPEEAGGMDVPHQDKDVYNQIDGMQPRGEVSIGEQPELPVELPADDIEDTSPTDVVENVLNDMQKSAPEVVADKPAPEKKVVQKPVEKVAPKPAQVKEKPNDVPSYKVQLGAYGSEKSAASAWRSIKGKYARQLSDKTPFYEAVVSGDRTLYRLRVGPMATRADADQVCLGLRSGGQACIVVNP